MPKKLAKNIEHTGMEDIQRLYASHLSEAQFTHIFESAPIGIAIIDKNANVLNTNPSSIRIIGYSPEEIIGKSIKYFTHPDDIEITSKNFGQLIAGEIKEYQYEKRFKHKDGGYVWVRIIATSVCDPQSGEFLYAIAYVEEITDRKKAESLLDIEKRIFEMIASNADLPEILDTLLKGIEEHMPMTLSSILLLDQNHNKLRHCSAPGLPEAYSQAVDGIEPGPNVGSCGTAAYLNKQVIVSDIENDPLWEDFRDLALKHNLKACWSTPINASDGKVLGTFANYYHEPQKPSFEELTLINRMTHIAAIAIERSQSLEALQFKQFLLNHSSESLFWVGRDARLLEVNKAACQSLGYSREELLTMTVHDINPEFQPEVWDEVWRDGKQRCNSTIETYHQTKEGKIFPVEIAISYLEFEGKEYRCASVRDITKRKQSEELEHTQRQILELIVNGAPLENILETLCLTMEQRIGPGSMASVLLLGEDKKTLHFGVGPSLSKSVAEGFDGITVGPKSGSCGTAVYRRETVIVENISSDPLWEEFWDFASEHNIHACWSTPLFSKSGEVLGTFAISHNEPRSPNMYELEQLQIAGYMASIAIERVKSTDQLHFHAHHDSLTGLINRREFERRLERILSTIRKTPTEHALCYMDLDQFKIINDSCGHLAGDELLRQVGHMLQENIRKRDTLARLGGDEFGILMEHCGIEQAQRVANNLRKAIEKFRFTWDEKNFNIGVSIGVVPITEFSGEMTEILKLADAACFLAKDEGRNRVHVFHEGDEEISKRRGEMQWITRINDALENNLFDLWTQPIYSYCNTESPQNFYECLIRLKHDEEIILPGAFLPAAERYGLSAKIDRWVVNTFCNAVIEHPQLLDNSNLFFINLSGNSLGDKDFLAFLLERFNQDNISFKNICFEITETAAITNLSTAIEFIKTLKNKECYFALDDFGSGLSSFTYLKNLPVDFLKIDGVFVKDIVNDKIAYSMVKSINEIGKIMGKQIIAESVENKQIEKYLQDINIDYMQGYGLGEPCPMSDIK